ncbi:cyclophilin-like fold protein [Leclercia sp. TB492]|uniref:cyclophilin-like fold protein n=1 Tax=Leclercia sp. TB492 TaxID=3412682 RepID=UPI003CF5DD16
MFKPVMLALASLTAVSFSSLGAEAEGIRVKITAGDQVMTATFYDNATTRALVSRFPLTLPMEDLYGREMCYRFPDALPANETQTSGYELGDIVYWAPRHSFVIMYKQNGEKISNLQKVGRIHAGAGHFSHTGDIQVKFELDSASTDIN